MVRCARCWLNAVLLSFLTQLAPGAEPGGNWPQWRGPNRDNVSADTGLLQAWPDSGPPLQWSVEGVGAGIAAVAVADGRVYVVGYIGDREYVTALDERTGDRLWAAPIGPALEENPLMRWLSQRTPTIDENQLYVVHTQGDLVCLSTSDGTVLWRKNYSDEFGRGHFIWGYCDYPLIEGDRLICAPGSPQAMLAALDKQTGQTIWQTPSDVELCSTYAPIVAAELGGVRQYVSSLESGVVGIAADDGRLLWRYPIGTIHGTQAPMVVGDSVLCPYGYGTQLIRLTHHEPDEPGVLTAAYAVSAGSDPFEDNGFVVDGHFYLLNRGVAECIDWRTGESAWKVRVPEPRRPSSLPMPINRSSKAGATFADGRLYGLTSEGRVFLAAVSPEQYQETGTFWMMGHEPSLGATLPVVTGGRLYLRSENRLHSYDVTAESASQPPREPTMLVLEAPEGAAEATPESRRRVPKPIFVPTPQDVVDRMLELAKLAKEDRIVDLGSGDGRIVIAAARNYGCRATGYEIEAELVKTSRDRIEAEGLAELANIEEEDMYTADLSEFDVVAVYVYPSVLEKMKPQFEQLKPGARIVSHYFEIPDVQPTQIVEVESAETGNTHRIMLYTAPLSGSDGKD